jgi:hypothetical protein
MDSARSVSSSSSPCNYHNQNTRNMGNIIISVTNGKAQSTTKNKQIKFIPGGVCIAAL